MAKIAKSPSKGSTFSKPMPMMEDKEMEAHAPKMGMKAAPKSMPPWLKGGKGKGKKA